jgi:hypothetical protein
MRRLLGGRRRRCWGDAASRREEYHRLPAYIDELPEANPGSHLKLNYLDPDTGAFRSLFF